MTSWNLVRDFPGIFRTINLSEHTTWNIGGPSAAAFVTTPDELESAVELLNISSIPWSVLGRGSNTLAPTEGWDGAVVILSGMFLRFCFQDNMLLAGGGAPLPSMAGAACSRGLSGLEFAVGIPGSAGGAISMNAGAYGSCIADVAEEITSFSSQRGFETYLPDQCGFAYRRSMFQNLHWVVTGMKLKLRNEGEPPEDIRKRAADILRLRRSKFPLLLPNAGSVFKRPDQGPPPGKLIEDCGLKGYSIGGARVSTVHANFIENFGGATSDDVKKLMKTVQDRVYKATGIELVREIKMLGER